MHNMGQRTGASEFAEQLNGALAKTGAKVYARNKEALTTARAARGIGSTDAEAVSAVSSSQAGPATIALPRNPLDKTIIYYRDHVVKKVGDFGPGIRLSRATNQPTSADRADKIIATPAATSAPIDNLARSSYEFCAACVN